MAAPDMTETDHTCRRRVVIANERGLHARASARFVKCAGAYRAEVTVSRKGHSAGGTSIMGLLALGAGCGSEIEIVATGPDADDALAALVELVKCGFGEGCSDKRLSRSD